MSQATAMGITLEADERVVYVFKFDFTFTRVLFIVLGLISLVLVIGIFLLAWGIVLPMFSPRAVVVTNKRVILVQRSTEQARLADITKVSAKRKLVAGATLVGQAINATNALLAETEQATSGPYWHPSHGIICTTKTGELVLPLPGAEALGVLLARAVMDPSSVEKLPTVDAPA